MVSRLAGVVGAAATLGSAVGKLGCCGAAIVSPVGLLTKASGLLAPSMSSWGYELMYGALALMLAGLGANAWRSGRASPFVLGLIGAAAVLIAFHDAWDVGVFAGLLWGGSAALVAAVTYDLWLGARGCSLPRSEAR